MTNGNINRKIRSGKDSKILLDVYELVPEDNLEQVIMNEDFRYLFLPVNVRKYPKNPDRILPRIKGEVPYVKAANPELIKLTDYVSESNTRINDYFGQLAKNFSDSEISRHGLFKELEDNYMDSLSKKFSSAHNSKIVKEDSIKETTIKFIRSYRTDNSNEQGIVLTKESLET